MATSSYDSIFGVKTSRLVIPAGVTVGVLIDGNAIAGNTYTRLKYHSGGTLHVIGVTAGVTLAAADLDAAITNNASYLMGASEILELRGPTRFYLGAESATTIAYLMQGRTQGQ